MRNTMLVLTLWLDSVVGLAQGAQEVITDCTGIMCTIVDKFPGVGMILVYLVGLQLALRGVAEALIFVSSKTETDTDNKLAAWVSQVSWVLGNLLSKFGYSVPKAIINEKAIELAKKPIAESQK